MKVVSTGINSPIIPPGPERDRLTREGRWREFRRMQERPIDAPAPTLDRKVGGAWLVHEEGERDPATARHITVEEAAILQSYPSGREPWKWAHTPSTTIAGDPRITAREHHHHGEQNSTSYRLTAEEMSLLQSYPPYSTDPHSTERTAVLDHSDHLVVDLFAGTGVGVACQHLGVKEYGVEIMPEAVATREANGMETIYSDVWDADRLPAAMLDHLGVDLPVLPWTLWGSPPCQTFSMAGSGAGRKALDQVLQVIADRRYEDMADLRAAAEEMGDERIGLVLTPLHYAYRFRPAYIALEQVPPVLPVWEAMAAVLREMGYSVWTGKLSAEQYGVPQTRVRAILMARNDGVEVAPPTPTHSKFYSRDPKRLDPGVPKWVSMAEALGWGMTDRTYPTVSTGASTAGGGTDPAALGGSGARKTVYAERAAGRWAPSGDPDNDGGILRLTPEEAATLQSYPQGAWGYIDRPSPTVTGGGGKASGIELFDQAMRKRILNDIEGGSFIPNGKPINPKTPLDPMRLQPDEAATLQSYPPFVWKGAKTKVYLQIGNAVPPLLARHVLEALWAPAPALAEVLAFPVAVPSSLEERAA